MREVGDWMRLNGESVYGAGAADINMPKPEFGRFTQKENKLYVHVTDPPIGQIIVTGVRDRIGFVRVISDRSEAFTSISKFGRDSGKDVFINVAKPVHHTFHLPSAIDTVFEIELKSN